MSLSRLDYIDHLLKHQSRKPLKPQGCAFAPINIALCKYWGKRDVTLNLPLTSSLSIALPQLGTRTTVSVIAGTADQVILNGERCSPESVFAQKITAFLDIFRPEEKWHLLVDTVSDVPVAAGLASSASGFAALVLALADICAWTVDKQTLSLIARLGSGSACRSLWTGFVYWEAGHLENGMDSYAYPLGHDFPDLRIGLLIFHQEAKPLSSRVAMQQTVETSSLYQSWPQQVSASLTAIQTAIEKQDFEGLGAASEHNALSMHATMLSAWPPISYSTPETLIAMQRIWALRRVGLPLYFTQDAGPHLKLLFMAKNQAEILTHFPSLQVIAPF